MDECVFVGDSRADVIAGRSAGIQIIAVPTGVASREQLLDEKPTFLLDSLSQLPTYIKNISHG
jgi:phosphoglycolate phosphatase-like HAD superfamily hydrolase